MRKSKKRTSRQPLKAASEVKKRNVFSIAVGRALRRAAQTARKTARAHGTPVYVWRAGKVVAEKP